jgi:hypothetical protein
VEIDNFFLTRFSIIAFIVISWALIFALLFPLQSEIDNFPSTTYINNHNCLDRNSSGCIRNKLLYDVNNAQAIHTEIEHIVSVKNNVGDYITQKLQDYGWDDVKTTEFDEKGFGKDKDIYIETTTATANSNDVIILSSPVANGQSASMLLELARVFALEKENLTRNIVIVFNSVSGERSKEGASLEGSKLWLRQYPNPNNIVAAISLADTNSDRARMLTTGMYHGFTPLWLRQLVPYSAMEANNVSIHDYSLVWEYIYRSVSISFAENSIFLARQIPAVGITGGGDVGGIVEHVVRTMENYDTLPHDEQMTYLRLTSTKYLQKHLIVLLQWIAFFPFIIALVLSGVKVYRATTYLPIQKFYQHYYYMHPQLLYFAKWFIAFLVGFAVSRILVFSGYLPPFPTTSPQLLTQPTQPLVFVIVYGSVVIIRVVMWIIGAKFFKHKINSPKYSNLANIELDDDVEELFNEHITYSKFLYKNTLHISPSAHRRFVLLFLLFVFAIVALGLNSFAATLFLLLPCYFWPLVYSIKFDKEQTRTFREKIVTLLKTIGNILLILIGAALFVAVGAAITWSLPIGRGLWYVTMGAAYGLIPSYTAILFCGVASLAVSWLKLAVDTQVSGEKYVALLSTN